MDFDVEKIKNFYLDVQRRKEEAVALALAQKDAVIQERTNAENCRHEDVINKEQELHNQNLSEIPALVEKELVDGAKAPFIHDIELCESFFQTQEQTVTDEDIPAEGDV